tara:strand:- start:27046 stop:27369 length:324 start_codon:yes stop_codon:yes gene_type:complete
MSNKALIIIATCPNPEEAKIIAEKLIQNNIAACVNIFDKINSYFLWKSKINNEQESLLLIKTIEKKYDEVEALIKKMSSYELPEVIAIPVSHGSLEYIKWVEKNVSV